MWEGPARQVVRAQQVGLARRGGLVRHGGLPGHHAVQGVLHYVWGGFVGGYEGRGVAEGIIGVWR